MIRVSTMFQAINRLTALTCDKPSHSVNLIRRHLPNNVVHNLSKPLSNPRLTLTRNSLKRQAVTSLRRSHPRSRVSHQNQSSRPLLRPDRQTRSIVIKTRLTTIIGQLTEQTEHRLPLQINQVVNHLNLLNPSGRFPEPDDSIVRHYRIDVKGTVCDGAHYDRRVADGRERVKEM